MKYRLMDLLACPICKKFPLSLLVFTEQTLQPPKNIRKCELYCAYHNSSLSEVQNPDCTSCYTKEISSGILMCDGCGRWYPIEEEIPRLLPDDLRKPNEDVEFLRKWKEKIPEKVLKEGKPFSLKEQA
ncbi:MAG: Trm112 family protein [Thaumarchaeota archaeon]|nr:Trm112 family protein [Candidatus Terraquivivens yellowstonensis]MCL7388169.1 Trm112 family protein [Candidatus Terraquivivens yellowstonensis]MCL7392766.1 Trm112 family protein [Candidatus Terraquivivens yellowstonensis]MCL7395742.1 Trm112 family protein [Candidatus Terraquivivens yellowstonensis]MCL7397579.1 Trm112 family protein [Candidatus Terraquivivens yellowstonensis]